MRVIIHCGEVGRYTGEELRHLRGKSGEDFQEDYMSGQTMPDGQDIALPKEC